MSSKVTLEFDGNTATLQILPSGEGLQVEPSRLEGIVTILESWLETEAVFEALSEESQSKRLRAYLAQDMRVQAALATLVAQSKLHQEIVNGNVSIGDFGFPEFDDE